MNIFERLRDMGDEAPRLYVITTGAGAGLQAKAWAPPGISNFFIGAEMSYAPEMTAEAIGFMPDKFVSTDTAIDLAMAAYVKAWAPGRKAIGLGMTCSVASTREHRGDHRVIAAAFTDIECLVTSVVSPKGVGPEQREKDDELAGEIATNLLAVALNLEPPFHNPLHANVLAHLSTDVARQRLFARPMFWADGTRSPESELDPKKSIIFAGAYNPPHPGHFGAGEASSQQYARTMGECRKLVYASTATHPIKPALSTAECLQRARQMKGRSFLVTEGDGLYIEKARRFPGAAFIMGADAMERMLDPQWGPVRPMVEEFRQLGTRFLVPGRLVGEEFLVAGRVMTRHWSDVVGHTELFIPVDFRLDLSSTQLRAKAST